MGQISAAYTDNGILSGLPASHEMPVRGFPEFLLPPAFLLEVRAARPEGASFRKVGGQRDHAGNRGQAERLMVAYQRSAGHEPL